LGRLSALTGEARFALAAEGTLRQFYPGMARHPGGYAAMAIALDEVLTPPQIAVLRGEEALLPEWQAGLATVFVPDLTVVAVPHRLAGLPAVLDKPEGPGRVNGWLCRGVTCLPPIDDLVNLVTTCKEKIK
jgi:uncharacterized protein YyaL (SSP411 family)